MLEFTLPVTKIPLGRYFVFAAGAHPGPSPAALLSFRLAGSAKSGMGQWSGIMLARWCQTACRLEQAPGTSGDRTVDQSAVWELPPSGRFSA